MKKSVMMKCVVMVVLFVMVYFLNTVEVFAYGDKSIGDAWNDFFEEYRTIMGVITAIGTLTSMLIFIFHMIQLANLSSHPIKRRQAMGNIVISLICTALLGSLTVLNLLLYEIVFL